MAGKNLITKNSVALFDANISGIKINTRSLSVLSGTATFSVQEISAKSLYNRAILLRQGLENFNAFITAEGIEIKNRIKAFPAVERFKVSATASYISHFFLITYDETETFKAQSISCRNIAKYAIITDAENESFEVDEIYARSIYHKLVSEIGNETFNCLLALANYNLIGQCTLTVDLESGSSIVIDSEKYTVEIDGKDVTWAHTGDWVDELFRNSDLISIMNPLGNPIKIRVEYTERYL